MSYTKYPAEASKFSSTATLLINKLDKVSISLSEITTILDSSNNDFLSIKTLDANEKIKKVVNDSHKAISSDIKIVKEIADELEEEERKRQEALEKQEEGENNE